MLQDLLSKVYKKSLILTLICIVIQPINAGWWLFGKPELPLPVPVSISQLPVGTELYRNISNPLPIAWTVPNANFLTLINALSWAKKHSTITRCVSGLAASVIIALFLRKLICSSEFMVKAPAGKSIILESHVDSALARMEGPARTPEEVKHTTKWLNINSLIKPIGYATVGLIGIEYLHNVIFKLIDSDLLPSFIQEYGRFLTNFENSFKLPEAGEQLLYKCINGQYALIGDMTAPDVFVQNLIISAQSPFKMLANTALKPTEFLSRALGFLFSRKCVFTAIAAALLWHAYLTHRKCRVKFIERDIRKNIEAYYESQDDSQGDGLELAVEDEQDDREEVLEKVIPDKLLPVIAYLSGSIEANMPHKLFLYGPPGTGKTTLAKEIARKSNKHFILYDVLNLLSRFEEEGPAMAENICNEVLARNEVICIDWIDFIPFDTSDWNNYKDFGVTVTALLKRLSEAAANKNIFLICIAMYPEKVREEIRGLFSDCSIKIDIPDLEAVKKLLNYYVQKEYLLKESFVFDEGILEKAANSLSLSKLSAREIEVFVLHLKNAAWHSPPLEGKRLEEYFWYYCKHLVRLKK
jgi:hypothetical protein